MLVGLSILLALVIGFAAGWFERDIRIRLATTTQLALKAFQRSKPQEVPDSRLVEPTDDPVAAARAEFEARSKRLNP